MKIKKPDENDIVIFIYIAFVILMVLVIIWNIAGTFKILISDLPFWMKWALLTK